MDSYKLRRELPNTKVNARKMLEKLSQTLVMSTCTQIREAAQASQILAQQQAEAYSPLKPGRVSAGESGQHFMQRPWLCSYSGRLARSGGGKYQVYAGVFKSICAGAHRLAGKEKPDESDFVWHQQGCPSYDRRQTMMQRGKTHRRLHRVM